MDVLLGQGYANPACRRIPISRGSRQTNLGSLYKGVVRDMFVNFKHLRMTKHTHNPVDDARGNAEALLQIREQYGLKISLK